MYVQFTSVSTGVEAKASLLLVETVFLDIEKQLLPFVRYSWLLKQFLTSSSIPFVETDFLSRERVFFYLELCRSFWNSGVATFFKEEPYSCSWKLIFWLVEVDFFHFSDTPASESFFLSSGNVFLTEFFIPCGGKGFSVQWELFSFIPCFFPSSGNRQRN